MSLPNDSIQFEAHKSPNLPFTLNPYIANFFDRPWLAPIALSGDSSSVANAGEDVGRVVIRYHFLDNDRDVAKNHIRAACKEWEVWANISFKEESNDGTGLGAAGVLGALRGPLVAAANAEASAKIAIDNAKLAAITTARDNGVPGAGASLAGARTEEISKGNWSVVDRALAEAAERRLGAVQANPEDGADEDAADIAAARMARRALDEADTRKEELVTAVNGAGNPNLPPVVFIKLLPPDQWSFSGCGRFSIDDTIEVGYVEVERMMMYLSVSDVAHDTENPNEEQKAKIDHDRGTILHEFGHTLGFQHEHQSPSRVGTFAFRADAFKNHWRWDTPGGLGVDPLNSILAYSRLDEDSIMMYHLPAAATTLGRVITRKHNLSDLDKAYAMILYPRPAGIRPPPAPWATELPKHALNVIGIPTDHPARTKILEMYGYLADSRLNIRNDEWRGVDARDRVASHRTRNIIQTIRHTLSTWSLAEGAAARARQALDAATKAHADAEAALRLVEGGTGATEAEGVRVELEKLVKSHKESRERKQKEHTASK